MCDSQGKKPEIGINKPVRYWSFLHHVHSILNKSQCSKCVILFMSILPRLIARRYCCLRKQHIHVQSSGVGYYLSTGQINGQCGAFVTSGQQFSPRHGSCKIGGGCWCCGIACDPSGNRQRRHLHPQNHCELLLLVSVKS